MSITQPVAALPMNASSHPPPVRCRHCGDVIGVYEPLVLLTAEGHRETSLAADPDVEGTASPVYHRACAAHAGSE